MRLETWNSSGGPHRATRALLGLEDFTLAAATDGPEASTGVQRSSTASRRGEMADAADLKSAFQKWEYRFESGRRHSVNT